MLSKNNCSLADAQELCSCISGRCLQTANCSGSLSAFAACKWHYYSLIALAHHVVFWLVSSYSASQRQGKRNICLSSSQLLTCKKKNLEGVLRAIPAISWEVIRSERVSTGRGGPSHLPRSSCSFSDRFLGRRMPRVFVLSHQPSEGWCHRVTKQAEQGFHGGKREET